MVGLFRFCWGESKSLQNGDHWSTVCPDVTGGLIELTRNINYQSEMFLATFDHTGGYEYF